MTTIIYDKYKYQNINLISKGAFGKIYKGNNLEDDSEIIIKTVNKLKVNINLLNNEIDVLYKLKDYCIDYIVCIKDVFDIDSEKFIIMEYLENYIDIFEFKLEKEIEISSFEDYNMIFNGLINGLKLIHSLNVIHKDIKPENILINTITLKIKYIDFGFSETRDSFEKKDDDEKGNLNGTPEYLDLVYFRNVMSRREGWSDYVITFDDLINADIWALGIVIYFLITSTNPFNVYLNNGIKSDSHKEKMIELFGKFGIYYGEYLGLYLVTYNYNTTNTQLISIFKDNKLQIDGVLEKVNEIRSRNGEKEINLSKLLNFDTSERKL